MANKQREKIIQRSLCAYIKKEYPNIIFASDFAAGIKLPRSLAVQQKQMKSDRGYPDLFVAHTVRRYSGLFIELKAEGEAIFLKNGKTSTREHIQEQSEMLKRLRDEGYIAEFAVGYDQAKALVDWYMDGAEDEILIQRNNDGHIQYINTNNGEIF